MQGFWTASTSQSEHLRDNRTTDKQKCQAITPVLKMDGDSVWKYRWH
jgi:hypothetical protein